MRKNVKEIENVFQSHGFSIDSIIQNVMKKFKFRSLCHQVGVKKQQGYSVTDIMTLLLLLPLMLITSVNALFKSNYQNVSGMKKDTLYRLKNNECMPWRNLLLVVAKQFQKLVNPNKELAENTAFILDDTIDIRTGRKIENISYVHDHVAGRKKSTLGFKNLTLGLFDGTSFTPLDFSLHAEKALKQKQRKEQYTKTRDPRSNGAKRKKECSADKITSALMMLKGQ